MKKLITLLLSLVLFNITSGQIGLEPALSKTTIIYCCGDEAGEEYAPLRAFPSAVGAGAYITGGRGGQVIKVTNLNDSGAGSLRAALTTTGPRIVIFDVSGEIDLLSEIVLNNAHSNLTVAGQTAPEGGITIKGHIVHLGGGIGGPLDACDNTIWRYIRFRSGFDHPSLPIYEHNFRSTGSVGLILDHCSISFSYNEGISLTGAYGPLKNITVQRTLFSQNQTNIVAGSGVDRAHHTGDMTFAYNLYCNSMQRTPNPAGDLQYDIYNNVMFNIQNRLVNVSTGDADINFIGNHILEGNNSIYENHLQLGNFSGDVQISPVVYTANNYHEVLYTTPQLDDRDLWTDFWDKTPLAGQYFTVTQFPLKGYAPTILSAADARTDVLADVGNNKYLNLDGTWTEYIDDYDTERIDDATNEVSREPQPINLGSLPYPTLPNNTKSGYDTSGDGIPDVWAVAKGFLATDDLTYYNWPSGYVGIEEYLNEIDTPAPPQLAPTYVMSVRQFHGWDKAVFLAERSSDSQTRYIFFDSGGEITLDSPVGTTDDTPTATTLTQWAGTDDVWVDTWYLQNATGNIIPNINPGNFLNTRMPTILTAGALNTKDGKATILFDGVDDWLFSNGALSEIADTEDWTIATVSYKNGSNGFGTIFNNVNSSSDPRILIQHDQRTDQNMGYIYDGTSFYINNYIAQHDDNDLRLITTTYSLAHDLTGYYNGDIQEVVNTSGATYNNERLTIGSFTLSNQELNGGISEIQIWDNIPTLTDLHTNTKTYFSIN